MDQNLNLGADVNVKTTSDPSPIDATTAAFQKLVKTLEDAGVSIKSLKDETDNAESSLGRIAQHATEAAQAHEQLRTSVSGARGEIGAAEREVGPLGGFLADVSEHARLFGSAFSAAGLDAEAASARFSGLGQILVGLGDAAPQILAVAAAAATMFAAFDIGKHAIDVAGQTQMAMFLLGNAVKDQGKNWDDLSASVKRWADTQSATTNFTTNEVLTSLNRLVITGMSVKDAMTTVRVAEDAAAGTGRDLESTTRLLMMAEEGRATGLVRLGILTKAQIHDGITFNEVLGLIEKKMGGDAAGAAKTYEGSLSGLHAASDKLYTDLGENLLPLFSQIVQSISSVVRAMDTDLAPEFKQIGEWAQSEVPKVQVFFDEMYERAKNAAVAFEKDVWPAIQHLGKAFEDLATGAKHAFETLTQGSGVWDAQNSKVDTLSSDIGYILEQLAEFLEDLAKIGSSSDQVWADFVSALQPVMGALQTVDGLLATIYGSMQAVVGLAQAAGGGGLGTFHDSSHIIKGGVNNIVGGAYNTVTSYSGQERWGQHLPGSGSAGGWAQSNQAAPGSAGGWSGGTGGVSTHITGGDTNIGTASHGKTGPGQQSFQPMELTTQKEQFKGIEDAAKAADEAVKNFAEQEKYLKDYVGGATTEQEKLRREYEVYNQEISGTSNLITKLTALHKEQNDALVKVDHEVEVQTQKYNTAAEAYNTAAAAVDKLNSPTKAQVQHVHELQKEAEAAKKTFDEYTASQTKLTSETQRTNTELENQKHKLQELQNEISAAQLKWNEFLDKEQRDTQTKLATMGLSTRQLYEYYEQLYNQDYQAWAAAYAKRDAALMNYILPQMENDLKQANQAYAKIYEEDYNTWKSWVDKATSYFQKFVDDVVVQHKNLRDELKGIFLQIEEYFVQMIAKMIAESILFSGFFKNIFMSSGNNSFLSGLFGLGGGPSTSSPFGGGESQASPFSSGVQSAAQAGASSYGLLGAFLGSSGASSVVAMLATTAGSGGGGGNTNPGLAALLNPSLNFSAFGSGSLNQATSSAGQSAQLSGIVASLGGSTTSSASSGNAAAAIFGGGGGAGGSGFSSLIGGSGFSNAASSSGGGSPLTGIGTGGFNFGSTAGDISQAYNSSASGNAYYSMYNAQMAAQGGTSSLGGGYGPGGSGTAATVPLSKGLFGIGATPGELLTSGAFGSLISKLAFQGRGDSGLGGFLGGAGGLIAAPLIASLLSGGFLSGVGIPALLAGGPVGIGILLGSILLGGLVGGGLGSLFGNHFNPADEPDITQQKQWGQILADLQGSTAGNPMNANGAQYTMDSWTSSMTGGLGWNVMMENFVNMFRNTQKELPDELQQGFSRLDALWGGAQNTAEFRDNGKNGYLQLGSGSYSQWTEYWDTVRAYGPQISTIMSQYKPSDLYAANMNGSLSSLGGFTPQGDVWLLHNFPDSGLPPGSSSSAPSVVGTPGLSKKTLSTINIINQFGGSLIAEKTVGRYIDTSITEQVGNPLYNVNQTTGG